MTSPRKPWKPWFKQVSLWANGLLAHRPVAPRPAPDWAVAQLQGFGRWEAYLLAGKPTPRPKDVWTHVPSWSTEDDPGWSPWKLYELKHPSHPAPHQPFNPATLARPPFVGAGLYVAEEVGNPDVFEGLLRYCADPRLKWVAMIPYYWTDGMVAALQQRCPHVEPTPWLSWWGNKHPTDTRKDANGDDRAGVLHWLTMFKAKAYIGECEPPGDMGSVFRTAYSHANIREQLALAEPLDEHGYRRAIVSDHVELIAGDDGKFARGWDIQVEAYADEVERLSGNGHWFRPATQLQLHRQRFDDAHPVGFQPVRGYFAPENGPWRDEARGWYAEDQALLHFSGWAGWRWSSIMSSPADREALLK